ncbi:hypothetical protein HMPREF1544_07918 [Mucor circinelloides 1006PhL]|uniref:Uncharacterized protein n=1 Tax=Mucor circinelloides f. circinelloides (strain 1006PhL) TaxID=1220926 RepID=S2J6L6_MUCC1|nr:hypothetical protein HMPREF1544_07918 [Mucor circinelloides 1006PhL]
MSLNYRNAAIKKAEDMNEWSDCKQLTLNGIMLIENDFINSDIVSYDVAQAIIKEVDQIGYCQPRYCGGLSEDTFPEFRIDQIPWCCGKRAGFSVVSTKSNHALLLLEAKSNKTKGVNDLIKLCRELKDTMVDIEGQERSGTMLYGATTPFTWGGPFLLLHSIFLMIPIMACTCCDRRTKLGVLWKYTKRFSKTTALGFNQWLKKQNIDFLNQEPKRKVLKIQGSETEKLRIRILSVLDSQFHDEVADNIVSTVQSPDTMHTLNNSKMMVRSHWVLQEVEESK